MDVAEATESDTFVSDDSGDGGKVSLDVSVAACAGLNSKGVNFYRVDGKCCYGARNEPFAIGNAEDAVPCPHLRADGDDYICLHD